MEKIWMKHWPEDLPKKVIFSEGEKPIFEYLRLHARRTPDKAAIINYGTTITYKELDDASDAFAAYLIEIGLQKGDRVGLFLGNCPQYIIAHFGIQKMGGIVCPCSPLFKKMELSYEVNNAQMKCLLTLDIFWPVVGEALKEMPTLVSIVTTNFNDYLPEKPQVQIMDYMKIPKQEIAGTTAFSEIILNYAGASVPAVEIDLHEDIALFEYTGGTSGLPKGAMLSHYAHLYKPSAANMIMGINSESRVLTTMPFFNIAGMLFLVGPVLQGATNILLTQFDPLSVLQAIDRYKATQWYSAVPMNLAVMNHPDAGKYDLTSLKLNMCTSFVVSLNEQISKQWQAFTNGCLLLEGAYGLSETHTLDTFCPRHKIKYGSMGIPGFEEEFKIVDFEDNTRELAIGQTGEIVLRNPGCMKGYWNNPEQTASTLVDGWVHTGDVGKFDEDGYLYWLGRHKEMIKVSGFSVFPEEVESLINQHPAVLENAVIPIPDAKKGEVIKTFIVLKPDLDLQVEPEDIIKWAKENMSSHKVPVYVEFRVELPKQGVKLLRRILRDEQSAEQK
ncbi:MAG: AMP-binding protein [Proteobacteria bacterium]|nr:AMP-binding protein [Pseudomonadota bacterium]MBU1386288.1 AMP-binding protein [Pseudomonadota bacterium]MBU1542980.1 AMP-binding protein [Pseudomonadota bacterium]MBU2429329.1 AMP-binding protein [Pseudomonadota bacterium]MBU2480003.1 AMP-binding protein [Pseudomonadota bacterium]